MRIIFRNNRIDIRNSTWDKSFGTDISYPLDSEYFGQCISEANRILDELPDLIADNSTGQVPIADAVNVIGSFRRIGFWMMSCLFRDADYEEFVNLLSAYKIRQYPRHQRPYLEVVYERGRILPLEFFLLPTSGDEEDVPPNSMQKYLATHRRLLGSQFNIVNLIRARDSSHRLRPLRVQGASVLFVGYFNTSTSSRVGIGAEADREVLMRICGEDDVRIEPSHSGASNGELVETLLMGQIDGVDTLHLACHFHSRSTVNGGVSSFGFTAKDSKQEQFLPITDLTIGLRERLEGVDSGHGLPDLVFTNACASLRVNTTSRLSWPEEAVASRAGLVIGAHADLPSGLATRFCEHFYTSVYSSREFLSAFFDARRQLSIGLRNPISLTYGLFVDYNLVEFLAKVTK